jgi:hypothetical protein
VWKHLEVVEIYRHEEEIYIVVREKKLFVRPQKREANILVMYGSIANCQYAR